MKPEKIVETLMAAKDAYYNGSPVMSDEQFDELEDELRKVDPANSYFTVVGAVVNIKTKVKHEIAMLSCDKVKSVGELIQWIKKMGLEGVQLLAEPKIDGMSCSIIYEDGKLSRIATRGDGNVGQNITHIAAFVKSIPKTIPLKGKQEVRGELYLPKNTKLPNPENKPLRNIVVGFVNRKDSGLEDLKYVHFVAYQMINGHTKRFESDRLEQLEEIKFEVVKSLIIKTPEQIQEYYDVYLKRFRDIEWQYETDGLVFVVNDSDKWLELDSRYEVRHHHFYNVALKPPSLSKETIILGIDWQVSRHGHVVPTAELEPVLIGGRMVKRASLSNYENVIRMKLEKGDKVLVEVSGDVIPYLTKNISKGILQRKEVL